MICILINSCYCISSLVKIIIKESYSVIFYPACFTNSTLLKFPIIALNHCQILVLLDLAWKWKLFSIWTYISFFFDYKSWFCKQIYWVVLAPEDGIIQYLIIGSGACLCRNVPSIDTKTSFMFQYIFSKDPIV